ncbi:hypothetical protein FHX03_006667 [Rhizobium sp. BK456]|nr:hypothetical protein [Rhizobium sp. BK456]
MPYATARPERRALARGAVGDFVFVDCELVKLLGRLVEVKLPDAERLTVEPTLGTQPEPHPVGRVQLLASVDQRQNKPCAASATILASAMLSTWLIHPCSAN